MFHRRLYVPFKSRWAPRHPVTFVRYEMCHHAYLDDIFITVMPTTNNCTAYNAIIIHLLSWVGCHAYLDAPSALRSTPRLYTFNSCKCLWSNYNLMLYFMYFFKMRSLTMYVKVIKKVLNLKQKQFYMEKYKNIKVFF